MNLDIDINNIEKSFDRIAKEILTGKAIYVNDTVLRFTEIEFYYFHEENHHDNYTHKHRRKAGEWRFHNQGLDITFKGDNISDGGILIRGVKVNDEYINGPRLVVGKIFESFGDITNRNSIKVKDIETRDIDIYKTFRHLPNKIVDMNFHHKSYRYLIDIDKLNIPGPEKEAIKKSWKKI